VGLEWDPLSPCMDNEELLVRFEVCFLRRVCRSLVTANVPSYRFVTKIMGALISSEMSVLTRATQQ
jgi:hypothetical protein